MSYKSLNINSSFTAANVGENTKARIRMKDGVLQIRFTDRTSLVNLPKTEQVANLSVKGNGRRLGLRSEYSAHLEAGSKVALVDPKYGWFTVVPVAAGDASVAASISAS